MRQIWSGLIVAGAVLSITMVSLSMAGSLSGATFSPLVPGRVLETRPGQTTVDGQFADITAREENRRDHITVRTESDPAG